MKLPRNPIAAALGTALFTLLLGASAPAAAASGTATDKYVAGQGAQFESLAGSKENLSSLATGLRTGSEITLVEQTGTGTSTTTFTPATKPMGYGNITRSLDLANRQLGSLGITDPTAAELRAALNGGTVTTASGDVTLQGVLQLRASGMGWGKIAHTIGVFPSGHANAQAVAHAATPAGAKGAPSGVTTAAGTRSAAASAHGQGAGRSGIVTAAGGSSAAAGAPGRGQGNAYGAGGGIQTAGGNGGGNAHAYGRAGK